MAADLRFRSRPVHPLCAFFALTARKIISNHRAWAIGLENASWDERLPGPAYLLIHTNQYVPAGCFNVEQEGDVNSIEQLGNGKSFNLSTAPVRDFHVFSQNICSVRAAHSAAVTAYCSEEAGQLLYVARCGQTPWTSWETAGIFVPLLNQLLKALCACSYALRKLTAWLITAIISVLYWTTNSSTAKLVFTSQRAKLPTPDPRPRTRLSLTWRSAGNFAATSILGLAPLPDSSANTSTNANIAEVTTPAATASATAEGPGTHPRHPLKTLPAMDSQDALSRGQLQRAPSDAVDRMPIYRRPLPSAPMGPIEQHIMHTVIDNHPELFTIVSPINIAAFEHYLFSPTCPHPNLALCRSVLDGLNNGFWPFAEVSGLWQEAPITSRRRGCHWSLLIGHRHAATILPPIPSRLAPEPHQPHKLRLISDHSFPRGRSVSDTIPVHERKVQYDTVQDHARMLRFLESRGIVTHEMHLWKGAIEGAFRLLPMHVLWMLWQLIEIDGLFHYDRCMIFGGGASALKHFGVHFLLAYVDDFYGVDRPFPNAGQPPEMCQGFLATCAALNFPVAQHKTVWGPVLEITGILVDLPAQQFRLSDKKVERLVVELDSWLALSRLRMGELRKLIGWINWFLMVVPVARPFLTPLYNELGPWQADCRAVHINLRKRSHFSVPSSESDRESTIFWQISGLRMVPTTTSWGLGVWVPGVSLAIAVDLRGAPAFTGWDIFSLEMLAIWVGFTWLEPFLSTAGRRIVIWSDSANSVAAFNTLSTVSTRSALLLEVVALYELRTQCSLRVLHVPGTVSTTPSTQYPEATLWRQTALHHPSVRNSCPRLTGQFPHLPARTTWLMPREQCKAARPQRRLFNEQSWARVCSAVLQHRLEPGTKDSHGSGVKSWRRFVNMYGLDDGPDKESVMQFMAHLGLHNYTYGTVSNYVSGVRSWMIENGHEQQWKDIEEDRDYKNMRVAIQKVIAKRNPKRTTTRKPALEISHLANFCHASDRAGYDHALFMAIATSGFFGLC
ncbi:hypothetical protein DFS34DRAFT_682904 [Phlyctochytrium arcticum]|nr:hypothetical protein DFS34DRAFT_682904 [Phlyctochytrium arcticum]